MNSKEARKLFADTYEKLVLQDHESSVIREDFTEQEEKQLSHCHLTYLNALYKDLQKSKAGLESWGPTLDRANIASNKVKIHDIYDYFVKHIM